MNEREKLKGAFFDIGVMAVLLFVSFYMATVVGAFISGLFLLVGVIVVSHISQNRERRIYSSE